MKKNTEEVHNRALSVSHVRNEILNFNREINHVFHSHSFSVGHGKLLCFSLNSPLLLVFRTNKPHTLHRRKVKLRSGGGYSRPSTGTKHGHSRSFTQPLSERASKRTNIRTNERTNELTWYPLVIRRNVGFLQRWNVGRISGISGVFIKGAHL